MATGRYTSYSQRTSGFRMAINHRNNEIKLPLNSLALNEHKIAPSEHCRWLLFQSALPPSAWAAVPDSHTRCCSANEEQAGRCCSQCCLTLVCFLKECSHWVHHPPNTNPKTFQLTILCSSALTEGVLWNKNMPTTVGTASLSFLLRRRGRRQICTWKRA